MTIDYFERTWIGVVHKLTGRRRQPVFKLSMWNKYKAVLDSDPTTTNASEGTNNAMKISTVKNANIWVLFDRFLKEDSMVRIKLHDAAIGVDDQSGEKRSKQREQRAQKLNTLVRNYGQIPLEEYMNYVVDFYNDCLDFAEK